MITGSPYHGSVGTLSVPGTGQYPLDDSAYIFIFENVANEGAVLLNFEVFSLHHLSILTVGSILIKIYGS